MVGNSRAIDSEAALAATRFPLLRRLSLTSLLAMLITATLLILLYRQDQLDEHEEIAAQENEKTAIHLIHLMNGQIDAYVAAAAGLDARALQANLGIAAFNATLDTVREHRILKLKLYNPSGITIFSTVPDDIGGTSRNPGMPQKTLASGTQHKLEFRDTFRTSDTELRNRHILATYVPLSHAEKRIGVLEIYADVTPAFDRIRTKTAHIALIVFGAFAALYAALFLSVFKTDRAIAKWQNIVAGSNQKLTENEARLWATVNSALDGVISIDAEDRLIDFNPAAVSMFGWKREEVIGRTMAEFLIPERYREDYRRSLARYLRTGETHILDRRIEIAALRRDGTEFPVELAVTPIREGDRIIFTAYIRDITERKQAEAELHIAAKAFESQEGMFITDADGVIQRVNKAFVETTGYSAEEAIGKTPAILKSGRHDAAFYQAIRATLERDGRWQGEIWNRRKNGEIYPEWQTISVARGADGQINHYISAFTDISKRKEAEEQISNLAFYDPLTQLPNRRLLLDRLHQALAMSARNGRQGALLFIDLDNFKSINDTRGHAVGDLLLVDVANRLRGCVREGDTIARLGGDEFVVLLEDLDTGEQVAAAQAETVGEKILATIGQPYLIDDHEHHSTASIGITLFRGQVKTTEEMLKRADVALYQAKAGGRNTMRFFDPAMQAAVTTRVALESDLRRAVSEQEQFLLYYQAQVDSSGRLIGAEALLRWQHPERGMVSPSEFIPLAEESGLILPLGHWVLATACQQLAAWATQPGTAHLTLAVNVSAKQFRLPIFVEEVLALVDYFGVNPTKLKLEITESLIMDNVDDIIAKMTALKARGISFSMDDFGTGYSSLSYLKRLPLYQLKIDQSFVRDVLTDPNDAAIARIIVSLAKTMNLAVIAEGVETEAQREFLELNGCHTFQGYLFSKPLPKKEFEQLVAQYA